MARGKENLIRAPREIPVCSAPLLRCQNESTFCYSNATVAAIISSPLVRTYILHQGTRNVGEVHKELNRLLKSPPNEVG